MGVPRRDKEGKQRSPNHLYKKKSKRAKNMKCLRVDDDLWENQKKESSVKEEKFY